MDRAGGRAQRKVESRNEVFGRKNDGDTGKHKHVNFPEGKYFSSIQQLPSLFLTSFYFIEIQEDK